MADQSRHDAIAELISVLTTNFGSRIKAYFDGPTPITQIAEDEYPCLVFVEEDEGPDTIRSCTNTREIIIFIKVHYLYKGDESTARGVDDDLIRYVERAAQNQLSGKCMNIQARGGTGLILWPKKGIKRRTRTVAIRLQQDF